MLLGVVLIQRDKTGEAMRNAQVGLFVFALLCFVVAVLFIGQETGDTLWRAGLAGLLIDLVAIQLWPSPKRAF
jgi:hypothetical protein